MSPKPRLLEMVLDAYREGDLDECIRLVRTLVEAAPQAAAPRQLLAALFASTGNGRLALAQYRRLLPQAVARGEVIRAIAFQKQIDVYEQAESLLPGRWMALQRQLREKGLPFLADAPGAAGRPWTESQLLALPRAWFERIAAETRFEILGLDQRGLDVESGTVWEVLAGRVRWSFALADGRASAEALAAEGDAIHVDPGIASEARVTLVPELPLEALRFEATLARDLKLALSAGLHIAGAPVAGLTPESRALLPTRPRRREDLDDAPRAPLAGAGTEPLPLPPLAEDAGRPPPAGGDGAGWVDFGVLSLPKHPHATDGDGASVADAGATADGVGEPSAPAIPDSPYARPAEVTADAGAAEVPVSPYARAAEVTADAGAAEVPDSPYARPAEVTAGTPSDRDASAGERGLRFDDPASIAREEEPSQPVDDAEDLVRTPGPEPIVGAFGEQETVVERRRHPRVTVSFASRLALLRLAGSGLAPVEGQVGDLSTSGFSIRFANRTLGAARGALADAVVAVDMEIPGPQGPLRVAAQVRWLDAEDTREEARIGIEFVLLTETDRRRLAGTLARAALAAREQERRAA